MVELKNITLEEHRKKSSQRDYEQWKHHAGVENQDGVVLTDEMIRKWAENPYRKLWCIFCSNDTTVTYHGMLYCPGCKGYKGLIPFIEQTEVDNAT